MIQVPGRRALAAIAIYALFSADRTIPAIIPRAETPSIIPMPSLSESLPRWRRLQRFAALVVLALLLPTAGARAEPSFQGDRLKALYLVNLLRFVKWPPETTADPITLCFVGDQRVEEALSEYLDNRREAARRLIARQLKPNDSTQGCHALYLTASSSNTQATAQTDAVLTISDREGFARVDGMIEFRLEHDKLRFLINQKNVRASNLRISSDLLKMAVTVYEKGS